MIGYARKALPGEAGFTMIELLAVCVIIGVLVSLGSLTYLNSRRVVQSQAIVEAAAGYRDAITAFQLDHFGRVPDLGAASDWPDRESGPVDSMLTPPKPYMRSGRPDAVTSGLTSIGAGGDAAGSKGRIVYATLPSAGGSASIDFTLTVDTLEADGTWRHVCTFSDQAVPDQC